VLTCCVSVTTNASPRTPAAGVTGPSHAAAAGSMTIAVTLSSPLVMDGTWTPCELTVVSVTGRPFGGAVKLFEQPAVAISIAAHIEHVRRMVSPRGESGRHGRRIVRPAASAGADSRCHDAEPVRNGFGVASHLVRRSQADRFAYWRTASVNTTAPYTMSMPTSGAMSDGPAPFMSTSRMIRTKYITGLR